MAVERHTPLQIATAVLRAAADGKMSTQLAVDLETLCVAFKHSVDFMHRVADNECTNAQQEARDLLKQF